ncbi:MAG: sodium/solute symporter [Gammaproteobacteria bacterium]|nr:sodium/solute symporter [Gammaproteobacteria bacterium]
MHWLDVGVLVTYFGGLFAMGVWFSRRNVDVEEYFLGGRRFKGWVIGMSLVGTSISSITFLAYPGDAFKTAWLRFLPNLMLPIAVVIAAYFFLPFFRRANTTTAFEFLEERFGPSIRVYGAIAFIVAQVVRVSLILYLISLVLQEITGFNAVWCIVIGGGVVAAYTILGGFSAVVWTDVIQTIVLLAGGVVCLFIILLALPGGLSQLLDVAIADGKLAFSELRAGELVPVGWNVGLSSKTATMMLLVGLVSWLTEYSSNQNTVQRFCASRSDVEARKAMFICAAVSVPTWAFFMFLGTALYVFFQVFPAPEATEALNGVRKAEEILPFFVTGYLPPGLVGLVLAAVLAAAMSSTDSSINAISTVSINDIYQRHLQPHASAVHYLRLAQIIALAASLLMMGGAIVLTETDAKTLQDTATILTSLLGGGLLSIYLIGFFSRRGDARHVLFGIAGTMVFTGWTVLSANGLLPSSVVYPFDLYYTSFIGNVVMFVIVYGLSLLWSSQNKTGT